MKLAAVGSALLASLDSGSAGFASDGDSTGTLADSVFDVLVLLLRGAAAAAGGVSGSSFLGDFFGDFGSGCGQFCMAGGDFTSGSGLAKTLFSLSTVTGTSGSGGAGSGIVSRRSESVLAIMAAISSMVSAEPDRVFLLACGSGGCGVGGFCGPFCVMCPVSPFSNGCVGTGKTLGGVAGLGTSAGGGGGTGTRIVRSGFRFRLEPGGAPQESAESCHNKANHNLYLG